MVWEIDRSTCSEAISGVYRTGMGIPGVPGADHARRRVHAAGELSTRDQRTVQGESWVVLRVGECVDAECEPGDTTF